MALSFACPGCKVQLQLPDEVAGQTGQCPRCQSILQIPTSTQVKPILLEAGAQIPPSPIPEPARPAVSGTPTARASKPPALPRIRAGERGIPQSRRARSPQPPSGPIWPWLVGIAGGLLCAGLLIASVAVLYRGRFPETVMKKPLPVQNKKNPPMFQQQGIFRGRLEGNRVTLLDGLFQMRGSLRPEDPPDPEDLECRCKRFEVALIAGKTYVFEQDSQAFDCLVRVENQLGLVLARNGDQGLRNVVVEYTPAESDLYIVIATCVDPAHGPFTLTIRERHIPKPPAP